SNPLQHAALAPLIGAALQVWWTRQAASLQVDDIGHVGSATVCPVCAARPVASVVDIGASQANLRYLHCSLCSTQWHMVRVTCSACESTKGVAYYSLNADQESATPSRKLAFARAETCDACHSYLKIFSREKEPQMEASADDLATLALDLLVDQAGYLRSGPNLLFSPGIAVDDPSSGVVVDS
ncbi:MAG: formate dehydrogenase accessory protein FdhE, partial [Pseudomonadota bacterium]|nr:formate dehydrogenase accessory protein FdhE [Pseudomonadota bacterium]